MSEHLSRDVYEALDQVARARKGGKPSACVARNAKHLIGIKLLSPLRDGSYALTAKGTEALFIKNCITGLSTLATDPDANLDAAVVTFLARKGHIVATGSIGGFAVTAKGRECLQDIAANG